MEFAKRQKKGQIKMNDYITGNPSYEQMVDVLKELGTVMTEETECPWCYKHSRKGMIPMKKHEMEWGVIDEDFGQYVHMNLIHYCPFCGRSLDGTD